MKHPFLLLIPLLLVFSSCSTPQPTEQKNTSVGIAPASLMNRNDSDFVPIQENQNTANTNSLDQAGNANGSSGVNQNTNGDSNTNNTNAATEPAVTIDPALLNPHETAFDCKTLSVYETMDFYSKFLAKLEGLPRYSTHDIKILSGKATTDSTALNKQLSLREDRGFITSACLAKDQSIFVAVIKGDDGSNLGFKLVRYILARDVAEIAGREDERNGTHWKFFPNTFGKRTGEILTLVASGREGDARVSITYAYNYVTNDLHVAEYCKQVGSGKKECGGYSY